MGFIVTYKDKEIWNPSLTVGNLYLEQIASIEKIIGQRSGVISAFDDEIEVDKEILKNFINACLEFLQNSNNSALIAMFAGCIEVSLYIYYLTTDIWLDIPFDLRFLNEKARAIGNI